MNSTHRCCLMSLTALLFLPMFGGAPAHADALPESWAPRPGLYVGGADQTVIHVEIQPKLRLVVWLVDPKAPEAVVKLSGPFETMMVKFADYHLSYTPELEKCKLVKTAKGSDLANCQAVPDARVGELSLKSETSVRLTLGGQCSQGLYGYQFCFHQEEDNKVVVVCSEVQDPTRHCEPPPPMDGALINPPVFIHQDPTIVPNGPDVPNSP